MKRQFTDTDLMLYYYCELPPEDRTELWQALQDDIYLKEQFDDLKSIMDTLDDAKAEIIPAPPAWPGAEYLLSRARREETNKNKRQFGQWMMAMAASFIMLAVGVGIYQQNQIHQVSPELLASLERIEQQTMVMQWFNDAETLIIDLKDSHAFNTGPSINISEHRDTAQQLLVDIHEIQTLVEGDLNHLQDTLDDTKSLLRNLKEFSSDDIQQQQFANLIMSVQETNLSARLAQVKEMELQ